MMLSSVLGKCRSVSSTIFSLASAFLQKNKTYKIGISVCVSVCLYKILVPPNNFQTTYPIDTLQRR